MRRLLLALTITPTVGWKAIYQILSSGVGEECWYWSSEEWLEQCPFLKPAQCDQLSDKVSLVSLEAYERKLECMKVGYISIVDEEYSSILKEIFDPPWVLFYKGDYKLLQQPGLGVVGSRKTTHYGRNVTQKLVPELAHEGWVITSGLASGIDSISHESTIMAKGKTIAVLGSGIDVVYPKSNKSLYSRIVNEGLIISEYPPGTEPRAGFFPRRNRIISGISHGVVVIEAAKKSGSLITAHCALEQGREVFAVPGSIFDHQSVGTNILIQQNGAKLVTNTKDILNELSHIHIRKENNESTLKGLNEGIMVDDIEKEIIEFLALEKRHINEIQSYTSKSIIDLGHLLLKMEMNGLIRALPGSYYQRLEISS
jgi:DNA processing protein